MPFARAVGPDKTAMAFNNVPDDRKADSETSMHPRCKTAGLPKPVEDMREEVGTYANTGVADPDMCPSR
jgi:hypothetical protein